MLHGIKLINRMRRAWPHLITAVIMILLSLALLSVVPGNLRPAWAAELPAVLKPDEIARVDFDRSDTSYRSLFPDVAEDREKIVRLTELYNEAVANLGPAYSPYDDDPNIITFFMPRINITLAGGDHVTVALYNGVTIYYDFRQSRSVVDRRVGDELRELFWTFFVPAQGVIVGSRELRMGGEVTISSDYARGDEALIMLMPLYSPVTIPSAPHPYLVPEAILLETVPVKHDRFSYTFTLAKEMGKALGGSPGCIGPGAWGLVVNSGSGQTTLPVIILPETEAPPRAVLYHQGLVYTWSAAEGVQKESLTNPADQPLLLGDNKWGTPRTLLSLNLLHWLDIPLTMLAADTFQIGDLEPALTINGGEEYARISGTMLSLDGTFQQWDNIWRIPWQRLGRFFDYREQWLGPETVVFLRNLDEMPAELRRELIPAKAAVPADKSIAILLDSEIIDLGSRQAYLDAAQGRVMVPLRPLVESLGGKVEWHPVLPEHREIEADHNYGLPPTGGQVAGRVEMALGDKRWGIYLTEEQSVRRFALIFGCKLSWDGSRLQVNLEAAPALTLGEYTALEDSKLIFY
jgi:hypothetical protein